MVLKEKIDRYALILLLCILSAAAVVSTDTGIWRDDAVTDTITQTYTTDNVCMGTTCYTSYQVSITNNASITGSPICTPQNDECNINGSDDVSMTFGEIYIHHDSDSENTDLISGTYRNLTGYNNGSSNGIGTYNDGFTIITTGTYKIDWHTSFSSSTVNRLYEIVALRNGNELEHCEAHRYVGTGTDVGSASATCIEELNAEDIITLGGESNAATTIQIYASNMNLVLIG